MFDPTNTKIRSDVQRLAARIYFYRVLTHLFRHPSSGAGRQFLGEHENAWEEASDALTDWGRGLLKESVQKLTRALKRTTDEDWASAHESCFGHTANAKVPSYELEYGEEHSHRQPQELADISAFYQAFGLQVSKNAHERDDHVSVECEFMQALLHKEALALSKGDLENAASCRSASTCFLSDHLGRWLPAFTARLSRHATNELMQAISEFAYCFILGECEAHQIKLGSQDVQIRAIQEKEETGCVSCQHGPGAQKARDKAP